MPVRKSSNTNPFLDDEEEDDGMLKSSRQPAPLPFARPSAASGMRSRPATTYFDFDGNSRREGVRDSIREEDMERHRPKVLRRTNSNDSIFASFQPSKDQRLPTYGSRETISTPPPPSYDASTSRRPAPPKPSSSSKPSNLLVPPSRPRHLRANSDSSIMEPSNFRRPAPPNPASEYARRESDRERRSSEDKYHRSGKEHRSSRDDRHRRRVDGDDSEDEYRRSRKDSRDHTSSSRHHHSSSESKRKDKKTTTRRKGPPLDTIDRLDVTGFFGPGSFHHDGPFDACTPHRNKNTRKAPVAAFPLNGANNSLAVNINRDRYATESSILMQGENPAYRDFSAGGAPGSSRTAGISKSSAVVVDPTARSVQIHGDTTMGLGSSTFLEGTPASKTAVETAAQQASANILRKKSLVNRLRGQSNSAAPPRPLRLNTEQPTSPTTGAPRKGSYDSAMTRDSKANVSITVSSPDVVSWNGKYGTAPLSPQEESPHSPQPRSSSASSSADQRPFDRAAPPPPKQTGGSGLLRRVKSLKSSTRRST